MLFFLGFDSTPMVFGVGYSNGWMGERFDGMVSNDVIQTIRSVFVSCKLKPLVFIIFPFFVQLQADPCALEAHVLFS